MLYSAKYVKDKIIDMILDDNAIVTINYINGDEYETRDPREFQYQFDQTGVREINWISVERDGEVLDYDRVGSQFEI